MLVNTENIEELMYEKKKGALQAEILLNASATLPIASGVIIRKT